MVKYSIIFVRGDLQENEAKELNVALQREHASKVTELTNRIHELEEESFSSKEEASSLTQQMTVLSKERNSIAVEKNHLESHLEDVQKMAFAAKSRAEELEDELLSLKRDHTKEVQELANKIHVSEEASSTLREETKRLHKDVTALIEAKNSLDCEKIDLEAAASRLTSELAASLAQIEDANRLALASKSEAEEAQEVIAALKTEHTNQMKELANRRQVLEEEISALKEETSSLSKKFTALIEEKDSLSDGNRGLEAAVSRLSMKLEESAANVQEAGKMTTAANLKVRTDNTSLH
jgi:chromosome segregation ATPase